MPELSVNFLDVGMGDSTLVIFPDGELMLVDLGEKGSPLKTAIDDAMTFLANTIAGLSKTRGKKTPYIDHLVLTHADKDHYNYVDTLVWNTKYPGYGAKQLMIGEVTYGGKAADYASGLIGRLSIMSEELPESPPIAMATKKVWRSFSGGTAKVYLLSANYPTKSKNSQSIVLMLEYAGRRVILPGDATSATEKGILDRFPQPFLASTALKLGHHGSKGSSSPAWLEAVKPHYVFASGDMKWYHPYCAVLARVKNLEKVKGHLYCCGDRENKDYDNRLSEDAVYLNLAYIVKTYQTRKLSFPEGEPPKLVSRDYQIGYTFGVQWELVIEYQGKNVKGKIKINHTDMPHRQGALN